MSNSKPLPSRLCKRSSRSPRRPPKRLSLRRLPFAPLPRWLTSVKSMTNAPRLRDAVAAEVAVAAEKAATVASMVSAVEAVVVVVAAEAVTSMVNAVVAVVAVAVAVVVIADQETTTEKMAKSKVDADVVAPMAITGIAEVAMVTSIAVKVEEAVVIAVSVIVVIVVPALKEKVVAKVVAKVAAEETEETLTNAMDISKVTDKMAPAVDVVETARVATREVAGVTRPAKRARSHPLKRAREPLTLQRKKRRRRLLAESPSPNLSKRRKKLASPLMTTWPRSRLTQRDSLPKRQT